MLRPLVQPTARCRRSSPPAWSGSAGASRSSWPRLPLLPLVAHRRSPAVPARDGSRAFRRERPGPTGARRAELFVGAGMLSAIELAVACRFSMPSSQRQRSDRAARTGSCSTTACSAARCRSPSSLRRSTRRARPLSRRPSVADVRSRNCRVRRTQSNVRATARRRSGCGVDRARPRWRSRCIHADHREGAAVRELRTRPIELELRSGS